MENQSGLSIRIKKAIVEAKKTQRSIAKLLGVGETTISAYTTGVSEPSTKSLAIIAKTCGVTTDWLITGKEPAKLTVNAAEQQYYTNIDFNLIKQTIEAVMEHLQENKLTMPPSKIAELVQFLYEEISANGDSQINRGTVARLIKLAI